jgi:hypothetical protein
MKSINQIRMRLINGEEFYPVVKEIAVFTIRSYFAFK